jgi:hypothetical protein
MSLISFAERTTSAGHAGALPQLFSTKNSMKFALVLAVQQYSGKLQRYQHKNQTNNER